MCYDPKVQKLKSGNNWKIICHSATLKGILSVTAPNKPQVQTNKQNSSFQVWLDRLIENSRCMATDEKFRQEVAKRATINTDEQRQALKQILQEERMKQLSLG